jgi:CheY-like chemotaxis protein
MEKKQPLKSVWLVDDDEITNEINKRLCELCGFAENITIFYSSVSALESLRDLILNNQVLPELIFLDLSMPKIGGIEFAEQMVLVNRNQIKLPVIVILTASLKKPEIASPVRKYITRLYLKPLSAENLMELSYICRNQNIKS